MTGAMARLCLVIAGLSIGGVPAMAEGLAALRWEVRPLLIFAPPQASAILSRQTTILADAATGLTDRLVSVYIVEADRVYTTFGVPAPGARAQALRRRHRIADDGFRVVLIGLDGGAKDSWDAPVSAAALFARIDGMPMRQQELRRGVQTR